MFFGHYMPKGVITAQLFRDVLTDSVTVRWRVRNDPTIHEMPFDHTDDGIIAVLTAMKLTC